MLFLLYARTSTHTLALLILLYFFGGLTLTYLDLYFLGLTYIIVYVGAIAILFIFLIMLVLDTNQTPTSGPLAVGVIFAPVTFGLIYFTLPNHTDLLIHIPNWYTSFLTLTDISSIANIFFNGYPFVIVLIALLLWVVLIGLLDLT